MPNIRKGKLFVCGFILMASFFTIGYRTVSLANINKYDEATKVIKNNDTSSYIKKNVARGDIFDRNKNLLATTIDISSLSINPQNILNKKETISKLKIIFPSINETILLKKINTTKNQINLIREITPKDHVDVLKAGIEGIIIEKKNKRVYPGNSLASHILGNTDIDGKGTAGIEKSFDNKLLNGQDVNLSIHAGVQHILKTVLSEQISKFEAEGGAGVIMNVNSGEIYALASFPDYNANNYRKSSDEQLFNRASKGTYELGSTLKLITAAIAYESKLIKETDLFDVSKPLKISSRIINDDHALKLAINIPEIIVHSSNIGSALIAEKIGPDIQLKFLKKLGLFDTVKLEIPEIGKPQIITDKKKISTMTISYGHGISITPVHLSAATASIINGGLKVSPTLIKNSLKNIKKKRIFSNNTSTEMKNIMRLVVSNRYGTGKKAEAPGYLVGGKTGTADKVKKSGGYFKNKNIVAFTGGFPINEPKFVITVMIDNPKGQKFSHRSTAGWIAAPVISKLVTRIAPILGINPQTDKTLAFTNQLLKYKIRGDEL
jgi:cell division protein FtsI (penicillin-binding protein 3)|tara:strand:- start:967 stop:2616 length:1650 start_codon:yes stop_codon:yes gene_type:complete